MYGWKQGDTKSKRNNERNMKHPRIPKAMIEGQSSRKKESSNQVWNAPQLFTAEKDKKEEQKEYQEQVKIR